jgi:hypothetical protein
MGSENVNCSTKEGEMIVLGDTRKLEENETRISHSWVSQASSVV